MAEAVPAHWIRVQTFVDESGLPAVLAMTGRPALPLELAETEEAALRRAGARVLRDLTGRPCIRGDDPQLAPWLARLDARVTGLSAQVEAAMQASAETAPR